MSRFFAAALIVASALAVDGWPEWGVTQQPATVALKRGDGDDGVIALKRGDGDDGVIALKRGDGDDGVFA